MLTTAPAHQPRPAGTARPRERLGRSSRPAAASREHHRYRECPCKSRSVSGRFPTGQFLDCSVQGYPHLLTLYFPSLV